MQSIKVFLDHFYFALVCVAIGLVVLHLLLSGISSDFSFIDHKLVTGCAWLGISAILAAILTYRTIRGQRRPDITYTRRQV
ncbi:MAG: hypothetical protein HY913_23165 [Desulfomonile tiedjei]|nr:hypothetical protein [Desulfomonile tiedjei]